MLSHEGAVTCQGADMRFDFGLASDAPGWADPSLNVDDQTVRMTASYLTDALGDLLNALILLVNGSPEARCEWTQEPGGWQWLFWRPNETDVDVRVSFKEDVLSRDRRPFTDEGLRLRTRLPLQALVAAVASGARRCLDEFGTDGFAERWSDFPFPRMQLESLEHWVSRDGVAPRYERQYLPASHEQVIETPSL